MKIDVNLRQYYKGKIGGMENYLRNVLGGLTGHQVRVWVHQEEVEHVREFAPHADIRGITHQRGLATIEDAVRAGDFDLYFCPLLVLEPLVVEKPSAVMMPDVQHEFFPEFFDPAVLQWRRQTYGPTALNCDVLFTLSEHAKETIVEKFRVNPDKIRVIHLDADAEFKRPLPAAATPAFSALGLPERYLYFPANFWPHKNHANVLQALRRVLDAGADLQLVLSGSPADFGRVEREIDRLGLRNSVRMLGYVNKALIPEIYQHALALLFTTKFEGFGIPLLEAFHCGCPAITSNSGSCLEVAGDAAVLVDPLDPASIAGGILRLAGDGALRAELVAKGRERAKQFSWQKAVELTEQAFAHITGPDYRKRPFIQVESWPVIGIVTPTYNMAQFLEETIESVLSQDYPHVDYVVMDAGSKDGSVDILRKYGERFRWVSEKDRGQADAVNKGYHATSGEIFTFLNSDDTYLPGALGTIARHFKANPGVGLIYGEAYHVKLDGEIIAPYPTQPFDLRTLNAQCYICQPAAFMLREAFLNAGMMNVDMHFALDYELWIRIAKRYGVRKVDEYLATSRMHMDNKTLSKRRLVYQEILSTVKTQFRYAPYEWINGYACYLLDRKDQYFDRSKPSLASYALTLGLGMYHNPGERKRFFAEWRENTGFGGKFTGRWEDGWISGLWRSEQEIPAAATHLVLTGKHWAPGGPLVLTVKMNGREVGRLESGPGAYRLSAPLPGGLSGTTCRMEVATNRTWRPKQNGDYRQLGCVVDRVEFETAGR
ncbi:MAG: glycosyltransferase [Acidobacteriaceae bacterium]|nr:glycosyltransferase [Acidobacteriaceae bacterium]